MAVNSELCKGCMAAKLVGCRKDALKTQIEAAISSISQTRQDLAKTKEQDQRKVLEEQEKTYTTELKNARSSLKTAAQFCVR